MLRLLSALVCVIVASAKRLPDIYWNVSNPTAEVFAEVNDRVQILCPFASDGAAHQSIIYRVSQDDFFECRVGAEAKEVGRCISPKEASSLSIAFRSFSPNPFALEYHADNTYYFITTSDGSADGLNNKVGGLCESDGMKMMVHISEKGHPHRHHHLKKAKPEPKPSPYIAKNKVLAIEPTARPLRTISDWDGNYISMLNFGEKQNSLNIEKMSKYELDALTQALEDRVEFEIHEIGDAESLAFSSSTSVVVSGAHALLALLSLLRLLLN